MKRGSSNERFLIFALQLKELSKLTLDLGSYNGSYNFSVSQAEAGAVRRRAVWLWWSRSRPLLRPTVPHGVRGRSSGSVQPEVPLLPQQPDRRGAALLLHCTSRVCVCVCVRMWTRESLTSSSAGGGDGEESRRVPFSHRKPAVAPLHRHGDGLLHRGHGLVLHAHEAQVRRRGLPAPSWRWEDTRVYIRVPAGTVFSRSTGSWRRWLSPNRRLWSSTA